MKDVQRPFSSCGLLDSRADTRTWVASAGSSSRDVASWPIALM
jgi:hypothetical protein